MPAPAFTITRPSVIGNLKIELTGFREGIRFDAASRMREHAAFPSAIVEGCAISSSGSDGVHIIDSGPMIRRCSIVGRHCALIASSNVSAATSKGPTAIIRDCVIGSSPADQVDGESNAAGSSEQQCIRAMRGSRVTVEGCEVSRAKMEGVVCMDGARVSITNTSVFGNGGPGIDVSGDGVVSIGKTSIRDNCGGVWVWDNGRVTVSDDDTDRPARPGTHGIGNISTTRVSGGTSHALLVCDNGVVDFQGNKNMNNDATSMVVGVVDVYDNARVSGIWKGKTVSGEAVEVGEFERTSLPPEKGPAFRFVPNEFTRKQ